MRPNQPPQPGIESKRGLAAREQSLRRGEEQLLARQQEAKAASQLLKNANAKLVMTTLRSQELAEQAEGFRLLVDSVKDHAIFTLDLDGRVTTWNPGAERIKGYVSADCRQAPLVFTRAPTKPREGANGS
jgi:PAS domain-containing protein